MEELRESLDQLPVNVIRKRAQALHLPPYGTKDQLIDRLIEHEQEDASNEGKKKKKRKKDKSGKRDKDAKKDKKDKKSKKDKKNDKKNDKDKKQNHGAKERDVEQADEKDNDASDEDGNSQEDEPMVPEDEQEFDGSSAPRVPLEPEVSGQADSPRSQPIPENSGRSPQHSKPSKSEVAVEQPKAQKRQRKSEQTSGSRRSKKKRIESSDSEESESVVNVAESVPKIQAEIAPTVPTEASAEKKKMSGPTTPPEVSQVRATEASSEKKVSQVRATEASAEKKKSGPTTPPEVSTEASAEKKKSGPTTPPEVSQDRATEASAEKKVSQDRATEASAEKKVSGPATPIEVSQERSISEEADEIETGIPQTQQEADALMAEEAALEADTSRAREVSMSTRCVDLLRADDERWLRHIEELLPNATVTLRRIDENEWQAKIEGTENGVARTAELCLRALVTSLDRETVHLRTLPEADGNLIDVVEIPEAAVGSIPLKMLMQNCGVVAAFVHNKPAIRPRPRLRKHQRELCQQLELEIDQFVEFRVATDWQYGRLDGFGDKGMIKIQSLTNEAAKVTAVDVRPAPKEKAREFLHRTCGRLVIIGTQRKAAAAKFAAMAAVDRQVPGHFSELHPVESANIFGFGQEVLEIPEDVGACLRTLQKVSVASHAVITIVGKKAFIAGEADERHHARVLLSDVVSPMKAKGEVDSIPEELVNYSSKLRVPLGAVSFVEGSSRANMQRLESETSCMLFWLPAKMSPTTTTAIVSDGTHCSAGDNVQALWDKEWYPAVVVSITLKDANKHLMRVTWEFDGSTSIIPASSVKSVCKRGSDPWSQGHRPLAIIGGERNRRSCLFRIMALVESAQPGAWTNDLLAAEKEACDGKTDDEVFCGVGSVKHTDGPAALEWYRATDSGKKVLEAVSKATSCMVHLIGSAYFFAGLPGQRLMAQEYVQWACKSRVQLATARITSAGFVGGFRPALSVLDADMRDDIIVVPVKENHVVALRPERIEAIEQDSGTLLVFDDGGGSALTTGEYRVLICGGEYVGRRKAQNRVQRICENAQPLAAAAAADEIRAEPETNGSKVAVTKSDPKAVLATVAWPQNISEWGKLQDEIWKGHPKLRKGWIRCWSRSQGSEYYFRLVDKQTTFNINDVLAA